MGTRMLRWGATLPVLGLGLGLGVLGVQAQSSGQAPPQDQHERLQGFSTVVVNHINDVLGTEQLPVANGGGVEPGLFVTITMDQLQVYDHGMVPLQAGHVADTTVAAECNSGCPATVFDAFLLSWLEAAVESTSFAVEIPQRVLMAVHHELPAETFLQVAYAASETRPVRPPQLSLLVNNTRGSLRSQSFFLVPPQGLVLRQGSAALGLTIEVAPGRYRVTATDPTYSREHEVNTPARLQGLSRDIKKRYPGKSTVILVPRDGVQMLEVMNVAAAVRSEFPRIVFSAGQDVRTP